MDSCVGYHRRSGSPGVGYACWPPIPREDAGNEAKPLATTGLTVSLFLKWFPKPVLKNDLPLAISLRACSSARSSSSNFAWMARVSRVLARWMNKVVIQVATVAMLCEPK